MSRKDSATQDAIPFVSPDGSLVIPRVFYLTMVAMLKWDSAAPDGAPRLLDEDSGERGRDLVSVCERLGMRQATYREIDHFLQAFSSIQQQVQREVDAEDNGGEGEP